MKFKKPKVKLSANRREKWGLTCIDMTLNDRALKNFKDLLTLQLIFDDYFNFVHDLDEILELLILECFERNEAPLLRLLKPFHLDRTIESFRSEANCEIWFRFKHEDLWRLYRALRMPERCCRNGQSMPIFWRGSYIVFFDETRISYSVL